ncbi:L-amino-acid oxidase-like [Paramuricea clavata]|uniref:L-amino-acid oxidase-like n=1 Tax=Paramuricea clavata TaxID=317549 RepID=A0A7D9D717_PARCT|nr:L-amino-acid oxidase-like [Paramuricea clavata]
MKPFKQRMQEGKGTIQQSNYLKKFLLKIQREGLEAAYLEYGDNQPRPPRRLRGFYKPSRSIDYDYDVIIVGAGMAGLSAAYELKKAGLSVKILEQTERYGGRVFTYGKESGLAPGLYGEAGAMRLPGDVFDSTDRAHFLTDGYITDFNLKIKKFPNYDSNGLTHIYGFPTDKTNEWEKNYFEKVWPDWKDGIHEDMKEKIKDIDTYYDRTTGIVTEQLKKWLNNTNNDVDEEINVWHKWINIWSKFTLESFLESNIDVIKAKVPEESRQDLDMETLAKLLPWSDDALRGYSVFTYTEQLDQSLVQYLRDDLGNWWSHHMHTLVGGMHSLADGFFGRGVLVETDDLEMSTQVFKISYFSLSSSPNRDLVKVTSYANNKHPERTYTAQAVIVTTTVNILRQITFEPRVDDKDAKHAQQKKLQAIEDIFTAASTKIILQTRRRFWEDKKYNIQGGFSKTNLPIGQIHYVKPDPEYIESTKEGIILIYTWKNEALIFGSLTEDQVKQEAIRQISEIHSEIKEKDMVQACIVHAWHNKPSYQGAYGLLKTSQFKNIRYLWEPMGNVHFAGEALSFAAGWIQGALESGLKAAYQVYARYKKRTTRKGK